VQEIESHDATFVKSRPLTPSLICGNCSSIVSVRDTVPADVPGDCKYREMFLVSSV
jgi:hypothetical protein